MNKVKLGDCIELIIDNRGKTPPLAKTGYELIETASINGSNKYPDYSKITKFVSEETYNNLMENVYVMGNKSNYDWLMESKEQLESGKLKEHDLIEVKDE